MHMKLSSLQFARRRSSTHDTSLWHLRAGCALDNDGDGTDAQLGLDLLVHTPQTPAGRQRAEAALGCTTPRPVVLRARCCAGSAWERLASP